MNLPEFRERLKAIISSTDAERYLQEVLALMRAEWSNLDANAQREANRILDGFIRLGTEEARRALPTLSDGEKRRSVERLIARTEGGHVDAQNATKVLELETKQTDPVIVPASDAFHKTLQVCLDLLFETRKGTTKGKQLLVVAGLFHGLLDELVVAFHLAQRAFVAQAYAHIRTVEEALDFAELFVADAALMDRWLDASNEQEEVDVYRALRRAARRTFGTEGATKLYAFLSALGSHPQFRNVQARAAISQGTATFFILGSPTQVVAANVLVVRASVAMAHTLARVFFGHMHPDDVAALLDRSSGSLDLLTKHFLVPAAAQMGLDATEVRRILEERISRQSAG